MLVIKNLHSYVENKEILQGVNLVIKPGEVHAVMGPNGSGKTSLAMTIMGHPTYKIKDEKSKIKIDGKEIVSLLPDGRAKLGLFVSFQSPVEIAGVSFLAFLRTAAKAIHPEKKVPLSQFKEEVKHALKAVSLDESFMQRSLNEGFSGGERKRAEIAQLLILKPTYAILDEVDSGLDIDSLKLVSKVIQETVTKHGIGVLLITHYQRILRYINPNKVHILIDGKIKKSGDLSLVKQIEEEGYAAV